jgi:hypothetical protein
VGVHVTVDKDAPVPTVVKGRGEPCESWPPERTTACSAPQSATQFLSVTRIVEDHSARTSTAPTASCNPSSEKHWPAICSRPFRRNRAYPDLFSEQQKIVPLASVDAASITRPDAKNSSTRQNPARPTPITTRKLCPLHPRSSHQHPKRGLCRCSASTYRDIRHQKPLCCRHFCHYLTSVVASRVTSGSQNRRFWTEVGALGQCRLIAQPARA